MTLIRSAAMPATVASAPGFVGTLGADAPLAARGAP